MSGNKKQPLVPRLRFPEFKNTAEWQSPTLGEVSEPVEERVGERKLTPVSISAGIGFVPQAEKFGRDISGSQYKLYTVVRDGDFVYNKGNSLKFPQGCVYDLQGWGEVAAPNVFICFRLKNGYENGFYRQCFERNVHGIQLRKHITSGARSNGLLNISKEAFYGVAIPVPSHAEQQKIADCLSSLDDLIAAETQKLDTLKTHKKGLMQQLFPREGETVPRLRFPEFREAGEWKIKSLGTVCTVLQGYGFPETLQGRTEGQYPFCKVSDISRSVAENGGFLAKAANYVNANDLATLRAKLIPIGATVFAKIGEALRLNRRAFVQCECLIDNNAVGLKAVPGVANDYFIYLLSQLINLNDHCGGAVPSVNKSTLEAIEVVVPEVDEQEKIAASMSYHDELIRNQEKKLGILKIHKAGLMQQLFPVLNGEQA